MATASATIAPQYQSTTGLARSLIWLLQATIALSMGAFLAEIHQYHLVGKITTGGDWTELEVQLSDGASILAGYGLIGLFVVTAIVFLMWQYRRVRNFPALGIADGNYTPGWSVGAWFVPFLNLVHGYAIMAELWRTSATAPEGLWRKGPVTKLIPAWWLTYLAGNIVSSISSYSMIGFPPESPGYVDRLLVAIILLMVHYFLMAVSAVVLLRLIQQLEQRQQERYRTQQFD